MHWSSMLVILVVAILLLARFAVVCSSWFWRLIARALLLGAIVALIQSLFSKADNIELFLR